MALGFNRTLKLDFKLDFKLKNINNSVTRRTL